MTDADTIATGPLALRSKDAAKVLGVSIPTLRKLRREAGLPFVNEAGGIIYPVELLQKWLRERAVTEGSHVQRSA